MNPVQPKIRTDLAVETTALRATPREGASFRETLGRSASSLVQGAEAAMYKLPGTTVLASALRPMPVAPGQITTTPGTLSRTPSPSSAEGPGAGGSEGAPVEQALSSSQDMNLYYLELQERMATENRVFTAQSNVLKARHDTVKNAIGNVR